MSNRVRILFVAESVTLAHVARPFALARTLDPALYEVHFAYAPLYRHLLGEINFQEHQIWSISPASFMEKLDQGQALYDLSTLLRYVEDDRRLLTEVKPDIVVGDFRLSLATSAELEGVPYVAISNACWSPYTRQHFTVPELPLTHTLGPALGQWVFSLGRPIAFALHCLPTHRLRRHFGLKSLGFNLRRIYTQADVTLYSDIPGLYKMKDMPEHHHFIGPVMWSPTIPLPTWWKYLPNNRPIVYVTLGSSGQARLLPEVIAALGQLEVTALVSTAGAEIPIKVPPNVYLEKYLPGEEAVKLASLVVCNGGSPTTHQALAGGRPAIGIARNLDQYLNMATLERAGVGILARAGSCKVDTLVNKIETLLSQPSFFERAKRLSREAAKSNSYDEFGRIINALVRNSRLNNKD